MTQIITRTTDTDEVIGIYDVNIQHLRNPNTDKPKESREWCDDSDAWFVVINGQHFNYYTGIGHRDINLKSTWGTKWSGDVKFLKQNRYKLRDEVLVQVSTPVPPEFDSILACLVNDAIGSAQTFDDWCSDYDYDTDSRKALKTYMSCQEISKKLRLARVPIEKEAERLQDY